MIYSVEFPSNLMIHTNINLQIYAAIYFNMHAYVLISNQTIYSLKCDNEWDVKRWRLNRKWENVTTILKDATTIFVFLKSEKKMTQAKIAKSIVCRSVGDTIWVFFFSSKKKSFRYGVVMSEKFTKNSIELDIHKSCTHFNTISIEMAILCVSISIYFCGVIIFDFWFFFGFMDKTIFIKKNCW